MKLDALPGVSVTTQVNDHDLMEYDDAEPDYDAPPYLTQKSMYVEAVAGAEFSIKVRVDSNYRHKHDDVEIKVSLDGVPVTRSGMWALGGQSKISRRLHGIKTYSKRRGMLHPYTFASLHTSDAPAPASLKETVAKLGVISTQLLRCRIVDHDDGHARVSLPEMKNVSEIPEKALKGRSLSNITKLGAPVAVPFRHGSSTHHFPYGEDPIASFHFKYRSRKDLQIEGIIPRSPSPVPLEERDPEDLTAEEARELVRRQRAQLADAARVKKEKRERADDQAEVEAENVGRHEQRPLFKRRRTSKDADIEVIDLCDE